MQEVSVLKGRAMLGQAGGMGEQGRCRMWAARSGGCQVGGGQRGAGRWGSRARHEKGRGRSTALIAGTRHGVRSGVYTGLPSRCCRSTSAREERGEVAAWAQRRAWWRAARGGAGASLAGKPTKATNQPTQRRRTIQQVYPDLVGARVAPVAALVRPVAVPQRHRGIPVESKGKGRRAGGSGGRSWGHVLTGPRLAAPRSRPLPRAALGPHQVRRWPSAMRGMSSAMPSLKAPPARTCGSPAYQASRGLQV